MRFRAIHSICLVAACCLLCHCSTRPPKVLVPESDLTHGSADSMLQTVLSANAGLETIKGIGRVRLQLDDQPETFRAAWIGKQPDRLLLTVLSPTRQPVLSFACDGKWIYLLSYSENKLQRRKATENSLKRIVQIDITVGDFFDFIRGRLPVQKVGNVRLEEISDSGPRLILDDEERDYFDIIFLDIDRITVHEFERRERNGKLLFKAIFEKRQEIDGFMLPESITIQDDNGRMIHIDVERAWANPELTDDRFVLKAS